MKKPEYEDVPRTLVLSTSLWAFGVGAGTRSEVFSRLPAEAVMALAILAVAFATSAVTVDERVRHWFDERGALSARLALSGLSAILVAAGAGLAREGHATVGAFPWAPIVLLGVPLTTAMLVTAARAALRERARDAAVPASSPLLFSRR